MRVASSRKGGHKIHNNINYICIALSYYDKLVADLEDRNSELIAEVNSLRIILTTEQNSPPRGVALPVNLVDFSESSAKQPSPPRGGATASGVQGPGHSWIPALPNLREVPE